MLHAKFLLIRKRNENIRQSKTNGFLVVCSDEEENIEEDCFQLSLLSFSPNCSYAWKNRSKSRQSN